MLKRITIVGAIASAFAANVALAEPTLEIAASSPPPASFTTDSTATPAKAAASAQPAKPAAQSESFRPTAATRPGQSEVFTDPDAHANSNP